MRALDALIPNSHLFLNLLTFLSHYNIPEAAVTAEVSTVKAFRQGEAQSLTTAGEDQLISFHSVYHRLLKVPECFPTIIKCYKIAMTIGVSSACAERSFSSQNISAINNKPKTPHKSGSSVHREGPPGRSWLCDKLDER